MSLPENDHTQNDAEHGRYHDIHAQQRKQRQVSLPSQQKNDREQESIRP